MSSTPSLKTSTKLYPHIKTADERGQTRIRQSFIEVKASRLSAETRDKYYTHKGQGRITVVLCAFLLLWIPIQPLF